LKGPAGQPDVLQDGGHAGKAQQAACLQHRIARAQAQQTRHFGAGALALAIDEIALRRPFAVGRAVVRLQAQKAVLHLLLGVRGDEGAATLAAHQQVVGGKLVHRLAHRALADLVARGQVELAGDDFAGLPFALLKALQDQALDLLVQRAEGGRLPAPCGGLCRGRRGGVGQGGGGGCGGHGACQSGVCLRVDHILYKTQDKLTIQGFRGYT
jgi:hypothetical protein